MSVQTTLFGFTAFKNGWKTFGALVSKFGLTYKLGIKSDLVQKLYSVKFAMVMDNEVSYSTVSRWISKFKAGQKQLKDQEHSRRPKTVTTNKKVQLIKDLIGKDARLTVRELARMSGTSSARIHFILRKISAGKQEMCMMDTPFTDQRTRTCQKGQEIVKFIPRIQEKRLCRLYNR